MPRCSGANFEPYKYPTGCSFFPQHGFGHPFLSIFRFFCSVCRSLAEIDHYGSQEVHPSQKTALRPYLAGDSTSLRRSTQIHFLGGRADLPRVLVQPLVRSGTQVPHLQCVLQLHYPEPWLEMGPVVREFHYNLPFKVGTTVFV